MCSRQSPSSLPSMSRSDWTGWNIIVIGWREIGEQLFFLMSPSSTLWGLMVWNGAGENQVTQMNPDTPRRRSNKVVEVSWFGGVPHHMGLGNYNVLKALWLLCLCQYPLEIPSRHPQAIWPGSWCHLFPARWWFKAHFEACHWLPRHWGHWFAPLVPQLSWYEPNQEPLGPFGSPHSC